MNREPTGLRSPAWVRMDRQIGVVRDRSSRRSHFASIIQPLGPHSRHAPRRIRHHGPDRGWRHGPGLSRARHEADSRRCAEDPARHVRADAERLARFKREAQVLASLNIPTSGISTASKTAARRTRSSWNWSRGQRSPIASRAGHCRSTRRWRLHGRLPRRSKPLTSRGSSIAI